jgi:hypothetical protein
MERSRLNQIIKEELDRALREGGRLKTKPPSKGSRTPNGGEVWTEAESGDMYLVVGIPNIDPGDSNEDWTATAELMKAGQKDTKNVEMRAGEWHFAKKLEEF